MTARPNEVKMLRVPRRCRSREMLFGAASQIEGAETILIIIQDAEGTWVMQEDGTTAERINWMLDRAKLSLHGGD